MGALSNYMENKVLDATLRNVALQVAAVWCKLHITGSPGEDCTDNPAANTTRKQVTFGSPAASGTISNTAAITWTSVPNTETYYAVSLWDAETAGNPIYYGDLTAAKAVNAGDTFEIPIGDLDVSID